MKSVKYVGMDVHQATTVVAVLDGDGKMVMETVIATEAAAIIRFLESVSGELHLAFEETTQAAWLYEVVRAHVAEVVVCDPRRNKLLSEGSKADKVDARRLAELLRVGMLRPVYHGHEAVRKLKELVRGYQTLAADMQRTMVRIKAIYRGRGIRTPGRGVYEPKQRNKWLEQLQEPGVRQRMEWLYQQLDALRPLRREGKRAMIEESRKHRAAVLLSTIPQTGAGAQRNDRRDRRYAAPVSNAAAVVELQRLGRGHAYELGVRSQAGSRRAEPQTDRHAGAEPQLQSDAEGYFYRGGDGRDTQGALSQLPGRIAEPRGAQGDGAADAGAQDRRDRAGDLEERRAIRSEETELDDIAVSGDLPARGFCR
jgi:hypothetical protein